MKHKTIIMPRFLAILLSLLNLIHSKPEEFIVLHLGGSSNDRTLALDTSNYIEKNVGLQINRQGHSSVFYKNLIIVCGGFDRALPGISGSEGAISNQCVSYNMTMTKVDTSRRITEFGVDVTDIGDEANQLRSDVNVRLETASNLMLEPMPLGLQYLSSAVYDNFLYVVGGRWRDENGETYKSDKVYRLPLRIAANEREYIYFYNQQHNSSLTKMDFGSSDQNQNLQNTQGNSNSSPQKTGPLTFPNFPHIFKSQWQEMPNLLSARSTINCQVVLNVLYCFGGSGENKQKSKKMDIFRKNDLSRWHPGTEMNVARSSFSSAVFKDKIYAVGGNSDDKTIGSVDVYNPYTTKWTLLQMELTYPRYYHSTFFINNLLVVRGGTSDETNMRAKAERSIEWYDINQPDTRFQTILRYDSKILHNSIVISKNSSSAAATSTAILIGIIVGSILGCIFLSGCCYIFCKYYCDCVGDEFSDYEDEPRGPPLPGHVNSLQHNMGYGMQHHPSQDYYYE